MIILLLALQLVISAVYYITAPFDLRFLTVLFWLLNSLSVILLLINYRQLAGQLTPFLKVVRLTFTFSLLFAEVAINLTAEPYTADNLHGFISDVEVLFTGITLGVLWHKEITKSLKA